MQNTLKIHQFEAWVSLGCSREEQSVLQPVHFSIQFNFKNPVKGSLTDQLADAIDYSKITEQIENIAKAKSYQLIEHLNHSVHESLLKKFAEAQYFGLLTTSILKLNPPIKDLKGGVEFSCQSEV